MNEPDNMRRQAGLQAVWAEAASLPTLPPSAFLLQHLRQALRSFLLSPITVGACLFTVAVVMFMLGAFLLLIHNIGGALDLSRPQASCRLYLRDDAPPDTAAALRAELVARPGVQEVTLISKEEALGEFRSALRGQEALVAGLEAENPLPLSLRVSAAAGGEKVIDAILEHYTGHPAIEYIQYDQELLKKAGDLARLVRFGGRLSALFMLLVTGIIIANTVRLTLAVRRDEISIMRLVGASGLFLRTPCVIEGMLQGLLGGVLSTLLLYGAWRVLAGALQTISLWRMLFPSLSFLPLGTVLLVLLLAMGVGAGASLLAVRRIASR